MKQRWTTCEDLWKNHDVPPEECITAVIEGRLDAYTTKMEKVVSTRCFEVKTAPLSEAQRAMLEQHRRTGELLKISASVDEKNVGVPLFSDVLARVMDNRRKLDLPVGYTIHPSNVVPIRFDWFREILQSKTRSDQCYEMTLFQFKHEDTVRCFGLSPLGDGPVPVVNEQEEIASIVTKYEDFLDGLPPREIKKWNAVTAYLRASIEGGEADNDAICDICAHFCPAKLKAIVC